MPNTTSLLYAILLLVAFSGCSKPEKPVRTVEVTAKRFEFKPAEIHLKQGELVEFRVTTADVQHGFAIPELKISEPVNPGKPGVFTVKPDRKGTFTIECSILCGPMHDEMRAKLVVE